MVLIYTMVSHPKHSDIQQQESKIKMLDSNTINQIAAGEVVERPASVLKELIENSVDAGARRIEIELLQSGIKKILVRDDGEGMSQLDAKLSLQRHATSKIRSYDDLENVISYGFRGEAIPSIASVSKMTIRTAQQSGLRYVLICDGGNIIREEKDSGAKGTCIEVENLFEKVPARLKFLKSSAAELAACTDIIEKYIVAYPEIKFVYKHQSKTMLESLGNGNVADALSIIWGKQITEKMIPVEYISGDAIISGFTSPPEVSRPTRARQIFFVNKRPMNSKILQIALEQVYRHILEGRKFPLAMLNIQIDASLIDINVSPTKTEVKFQNEKNIFFLIRQGVEQALLKCGHLHGIGSALKDTQQDPSSLDHSQSSSQGNPESSLNKKYDLSSKTRYSFKDSYPSKTSSPQEAKIKSFELQQSQSHFIFPSQKPKYEHDSQEDTSLNTPIHKSSDDPWNIPTKNQIENGSEHQEPSSIQKSNSELLSEESGDLKKTEEASTHKPFAHLMYSARILGQIMNTFIVAEHPKGLLLIDQHVAHERVLFEKLWKKHEGKSLDKQSLLMPEPLHLDKVTSNILKDHLESLKEIGFELEPFGGGSYIVRSYPSILVQKHPGKELSILTEILQELVGLEGGRNWAGFESSMGLKGSHPVLDPILAMCSCKMAVKAGDPLTMPMMEKLLIDLGETMNPYMCPHGRPIVVLLDSNDLLRKFKRK